MKKEKMSSCPGWACPPNTGPLDCPSKTCGAQTVHYNTRYAFKIQVGYPNSLWWWLIWKSSSQQNIDDGCSSTVDGFNYVDGNAALPSRSTFDARWRLLPSDRSLSNQGIVNYGDIVYLQAETPVNVWYDLQHVGSDQWFQPCAGFQFTSDGNSATPLLLYDRYGHTGAYPIQQGSMMQFGSTTQMGQLVQLQKYPVNFDPPYDQPIWFYQGQATANLFGMFVNSDSGQVDLVPAVPSCTDTKDCGPGQICQGGSCIPDPGSICNPPCSVTQLCVNNQCVTPGPSGSSTSIWLWVGIGASVFFLFLIIFVNVIRRLRAKLVTPS